MRVLINKVTNDVIAEIDDSKKKVTVRNSYTKQQMVKGIALYVFQRAEYGNVERVTLKDPNFYKAFLNVYCRGLDPDVYAIVENSLQQRSNK